MTSSIVPAKDLASFQAHLTKSTRILALLGAGLSASSGLPTFRGAGGLWRTHDAVSLATPEAFARDPALVWHFYNYRRHMALGVKPNPAHYALAELAKHKQGFLTLSQNVDGTWFRRCILDVDCMTSANSPRPLPSGPPSARAAQATARLLV
jgi:NAD-dependent deacetylase sirtuin 5